MTELEVSEASAEEQPAEAPVVEEAQPEITPEKAPESAIPAEPEIIQLNAKSPFDLLMDKVAALEGVAHSTHHLDESALAQIVDLVWARFEARIQQRLGS